MPPAEGSTAKAPTSAVDGIPQRAGEVARTSVEVERQQPTHQRFVLTDPAAFRYLEEDPSTTVLDRNRRLLGYELYVVEQWACSRVHPTFVITTYTGLEQHSVLVGILSVPTNEEEWSPRLRIYFKAIARYHARKKNTPLGTLMVTNLSGFPSALTVILVPDGDLLKHREDFIVNEDLKRMGCAGRAGLSLSHPVQATEAKFNRLYRTSDRVRLYSAVIELVKLCQAALMLFGKLAPEYADGLLCDVTEQAINEWWSDIGAEVYNVEPSDGILGPTTVAALIGLLIGARNRLHAFGAPVSKDVYDLASTKRGVAYFQKSQKLEKTRRLDRQTLQQLHRVTAKAAKSSEGWNVPRAVKSTMAELSGKGNELVVGEAREKAGIAEIETLDIETFVQLASGERSKWLWYGKPRKSDTDVFKQLGGDDGMVFDNDEHGGYVWTRLQRDSVVDNHPRAFTDRIHTQTDRVQTSPGIPSGGDGAEKDQALRRAVLKSVTGRMTDARSGLGRIRDAVGMRGHHHRYSKEAVSLSDGESLKERVARFSDDYLQEPSSVAATSLKSPISGTPPSPRSRRPSTLSQDGVDPIGTTGHLFERTAPGDRYAAWEVAVETESEGRQSGTVSDVEHATSNDASKDATLTETTDFPTTSGHKVSDAGATAPSDGDGKQPFRKAQEPPALQRTRSQPLVLVSATKERYRDRWPRHLSFSNVVDVVAASDEIMSNRAGELDARRRPESALMWERSRDQLSQQLIEILRDLETGEGVWVEQRVGDIEAIDNARGLDQEYLDSKYRQKLGEHEALKEAADGFLAEEESGLGEAVEDIKTLAAKLEYELNTLESKVEDVENAASEFERQVKQVEMRADELRTETSAHHSWLWWPLRLFT
ncbi:MAG: hypothetical protein LQ346_007013 [Caloplaca aetnensis]|nr:MAG: hypothetical protein LQ346_007013 [Caloplaca aetnensis]